MIGHARSVPGCLTETVGRQAAGICGMLRVTADSQFPFRTKRLGFVFSMLLRRGLICLGDGLVFAVGQIDATC